MPIGRDFPWYPYKIGRDFPSFPYNFASILARAPAQGGVYALFKDGVWIYIGETGDIRSRLLQHLNGDDHCITTNAPAAFQFELVKANQRVARQHHLILAALKPVCNQIWAKSNSDLSRQSERSQTPV